MLHCDDIFNNFLLLTDCFKHLISRATGLLKKIKFEKTYGMAMVKLTRHLGLWKQLPSLSRKKSLLNNDSITFIMYLATVTLSFWTSITIKSMICGCVIWCSVTSVLKQGFPVWVRPLAMCRGKLSAVITWLMSKCL